MSADSGQTGYISNIPPVYSPRVYVPSVSFVSVYVPGVARCCSRPAL